MHISKEWMLANALRGNTVVNDLQKTNPKIIPLAKTISWTRSAIV